MNENLSSSLSHYFAKMHGAGPAVNTNEHVAFGADCVRPADVANCLAASANILAKVSTLEASSSFRQQVEQLFLFVKETPIEANSRPQREMVFVLFYLLNGRDLIPDHIPEFGLVDDAHIIETAYIRNQNELRAHWAARGRSWPEA